jgi:hypothetical protein
MNTLSNGLDYDQQVVATADITARQLVVAGPGTGKTEVSALRLAHLIGVGLVPSQILVLSFSRSAVRTLTRRVEQLALSSSVVLEDLRHLSIRTFDSWAFRLLRMSGMQPRELIKRSFDDNISRLVHLLRAGTSEPLQTFLAKIRHIVVDEAQDVGGVRHELVMALLAHLAPAGTAGAGFTILGDDAQAIYQFAARIEGTEREQHLRCMDHVRKTYAGELIEIELKKNHRATQEMAESVRELRQLFSSEVDDADKLQAMESFVALLPVVWEERLSPLWLAGISYGSLAILTRTNGEALRIATQLAGKDNHAPAIPVQLHTAGAGALVPAWVAALLWQVPNDTVTRSMFQRIHEHVTRTCGDAACFSLSLPPLDQAWLRLLRACGLGDDDKSFSMDVLRERMAWPDAFPDDQLSSDSMVLVTTIHQSKGLEFDSIVLLESAKAAEPGENDDENCRHEAECEDEADGITGVSDLLDIDEGEEASVLFVAVTRAARHIGKLPRESIFTAHRGREFSGGRRRLFNWWNGWVNLEVGIFGDIDPASFVDAALHTDAGGVRVLQDLLLLHAAELRGRKVVLCKAVRETDDGDHHVHYDIHLQEGSDPGQLLGRTCSQLTFDLKRLLGKERPLPKYLRNLRIGQVVSVPTPVDLPLSIPEPWRNSRLWLGITLCGTGDFKPYKLRK